MIPQNLLVLECMFSALAPSVLFLLVFLFIYPCFVSFFFHLEFDSCLCICLCEFFVRTLHFYQHVIRHAVFTYACSNQMVNSPSVLFSVCFGCITFLCRTHYIRIKFNVDLVLQCVPLWFSHNACHTHLSPLSALTVWRAAK